MLDKETKDRIADFFTGAELVDYLQIDVEDVIDAFETDIEELLDEVEEYIGVVRENEDQED